VNWSGTLHAPTHRLALDQPKVHHIPRWNTYGDPKRIDVIARIAESRGHDPRIATLAVSILRGEPAVWGQQLPEVPPKQYMDQAARLLLWVQEKVYYVNEPGERLQDPLYTLRVMYGDCDDLAILYYALCRSIRLPVKLVIVGQDKQGRKHRYHQGDKHYPRGVDWAHIYNAVGDRPFGDATFRYAEPTVRGAPLGWDVVNAVNYNIPELAAYGATASSSSGMGGAVAGSVAELVLDENNEAKASQPFMGLNWRGIFAAALVGSLVTVTSEVLLDVLRGAKKRAVTP
jgi:hypothetical protein